MSMLSKLFHSSAIPLFLLISNVSLHCYAGSENTSSENSRSARELFVRNKVPEFPKGEAIYPEDTVGGYPIYGGNGVWRFDSAKVDWSTGRADSIPIGSIQMSLWEDGKFSAVLSISAALQSTRSSGWSGNPCSGEHLFSRNKGRGSSDDCLIIDAVNVSVGPQQHTLLAASTVESGSDGRLYTSTVLIDAEYLGFPATTASDWSKVSVQSDTAKSATFSKVVAWAEKYQDASGLLMDWSRPKDAFNAVPKLSELKGQAQIKTQSKAAVRTGARPEVAYVFCESSRTMIEEGKQDCPVN